MRWKLSDLEKYQEYNLNISQIKQRTVLEIVLNYIAKSFTVK